MKFGSICSGIEAASVAWRPLGWSAAWLAEVDAFPSSALAEHYPDVPNHGDMTLLPERILAGEVEAPPMLCGGTPCQAFSIAGSRESLSDDRGNLTLTFCEIADAIDDVRTARGEPEAIIFWENVPGVLSTKDNAFGCFLGELAGESCELQPPGGKWKNAGCVLGPQRTVAWRVLDAQYFGLAQRRKRVFVVASARTGFDPLAVLFEREGVRRDSAPSREARQDAPASTGTGAACGCGSGCGRGRRSDLSSVITMAHGQGGAEIGFDCGPTLTCNHEAPIASYRVSSVEVCPTLRAGGNSTGGDRPPGTDVDTADSLIVVHGTQDHPDVRVDLAHTLGRNSGQENVVLAFVQNSRDEVRLMGGDGQIVGALAAEAGMKQQCFVATCVTGDIAHTLKAEGFDASEDGAGRGQPIVADKSAVRRLTPRECERLQGFPDDYTLIPYRGKAADQCPDGPRYKALGNSWAVNVVRWIGRRIQDEVARLDEADSLI